MQIFTFLIMKFRDYFRVPETATVLLGGGVNFGDLPNYAAIEFQVWLRKKVNTELKAFLENPESVKHPVHLKIH